MAEVGKALKEYEAEVEAANLSPKTEWTYLRHASTFVRWLRYDFTPAEKT